MTRERLMDFITEQKKLIARLQIEQEQFMNLKCVPISLRKKVIASYKEQIHACNLNIVGAEDKYYDGMQEAQTILAEMRGVK